MGKQHSVAQSSEGLNLKTVEIKSLQSTDWIKGEASQKVGFSVLFLEQRMVCWSTKKGEGCFELSWITIF